MALGHCRREGLDPAELHWVEPSAGAGVFLDTAPAGVGRMSAVDIVPMAAGIRRADFLRTRRADYPAGARLAVIGNPPFGYQATMARLFIEHALLALGAAFVCFVVPGVATGAMEGFANYVEMRYDKSPQGQLRYKLARRMFPATTRRFGEILDEIGNGEHRYKSGRDHAAENKLTAARKPKK